jgi:hypothetical protein
MPPKRLKEYRCVSDPSRISPEAQARLHVYGVGGSHVAEHAEGRAVLVGEGERSIVESAGIPGSGARHLGASGAGRSDRGLGGAHSEYEVPPAIF